MDCAYDAVHKQWSDVIVFRRDGKFWRTESGSSRGWSEQNRNAGLWESDGTGRMGLEGGSEGGRVAGAAGGVEGGGGGGVVGGSDGSSRGSGGDGGGGDGEISSLT